MSRHTCHYCGEPETRSREMRPYGPGGSWVCFPCITASPLREKAAGEVFHALLDGAEAISPTRAVAIGENTGPRPFDPQEASRD